MYTIERSGTGYGLFDRSGLLLAEFETRLHAERAARNLYDQLHAQQQHSAWLLRIIVQAQEEAQRMIDAARELERADM